MQRVLSETALPPGPLRAEAGYSAVIPPLPWASTACAGLALGTGPAAALQGEITGPGD